MPVSPDEKIQLARDNGIINPTVTWRCAKKAGISYPVACALLVQESGGGRNVYGHDATSNMSGFPLEVNEHNYAVYKWQRKVKGMGMQGVGPCQLTYWSIQDQADDLGGCWKIRPNMLVGFGLIRGYLDSGMNLHQAFARYNGSESYADQMDARVAEWRQILREDDETDG